MLGVENWAEIRRRRRAEQMSISQIARVLGISMADVGAGELAYPIVLVDFARMVRRRPAVRGPLLPRRGAAGDGSRSP